MIKSSKNVKVRELEPEVYNSSNLSQELDQMYYFGWIADYPYPQDFLEILFNSKSSFNYGGYSSQAVDTLIQQANRALDQNNAFSQYQQAEQQIVNDAAILPLLRGAISSLRSCIADVFFLKIVFNDRRLLLAAS